MDLAKYIDHTNLKQSASDKDICTLITEAKDHLFASVCVNPCWVSLAATQLKGTNVKVCTVIGFPLGANTKKMKVMEAKDAVQNGADEIDMVINIGYVKSQQFDIITEEIREVKEAIGTLTLKVIVETCFLSQDEKIKICACVEKGGADYIKTSTGFGIAGATVEDVLLFKRNLVGGTKIKASGGIKSKEDLEKFVAAGCLRIGTSAAVDIFINK